MGSYFSSSKNRYKIMVVGLDGAGKTTMLYRLIEGTKTSCRLGMNHEEQVCYKDLEIVSWNSGGQIRMEQFLYRRHFSQEGAAGVIYLVDSNDSDRIEESAEGLKQVLSLISEPVPLLIFANKSDLPNALTKEHLIDRMGLYSMTELSRRAWHVQTSCAAEGVGLHEGLEWFTKPLRQRVDGLYANCELNRHKA